MTIPVPVSHVRLLNGFGLWAQGDAIPVKIGSQRLVIFLALHDRLLRRSHVAGTLWPDVPIRTRLGQPAGEHLASAIRLPGDD